MPSNAQDDIDAFLRLWGEPTPAELRLWTAALAPLGDQTADILAAWARQSAWWRCRRRSGRRGRP